MDQNDTNTEDISLFLSRLRLPAEYVRMFHKNGRFVVKDCVDLDEVTLHEIGISLPGHIRRILNKLPKLTDSDKNVEAIYDTPSARNVKVDVGEELENQLSSGRDAHDCRSSSNETSMVHGCDEIITDDTECGRHYEEQSVYEVSANYIPSPIYDAPSSAYHNAVSRLPSTTFTNYETPSKYLEVANPLCKPEDDYGRLKEDANSPVHLRSSAGSITGSNSQNDREDEYDRLDNIVPPSPRFRDSAAPATYSDDMEFETQKDDFVLDPSTTFGDYCDNSAPSRSIKPLPQVHLQDTENVCEVGEAESYQVPTEGEYLGCQRSDTQDNERNAFSDYNVLSLIPIPYNRKESADMNTDLDVAEVSEYDSVEYRGKRGKTDELPPAPHNTPDHILDMPITEESSYEEVKFPFDRKSPQQLSPPSDESIYSGINESVEEHKVVANKNKKTSGLRRSTGLQAQLQKAAESAKAAVNKRRANRKLKAENQAVSFSDNESVPTGTTGENSVISTTASLNDLEISSGTSPTGSMQQLQLVESSSPATSSPSRRFTGLARISPVTRRRRFDGKTRTETPGDGIYEDVDDLKMHSDVSIDAISRSRPVLPQRPISVFMETSGYSNDMGTNMTDRERVHSATLKPGVLPSENAEYMDVNEFLRSFQHSTPIIPVSPLAKKRTKSGWLWKHSGPEGRSPFRKRWAMFDGEELAYYEGDTKTDISKGILPVEVMLRLQMPSNSQTIFHLQMKGGRTLIFQAENGNERAMWASTLMAAMLENQQKGANQHKPGGDMSMPYKEGLLKMEGLRQKIYMAIKGEQAVYYKSKNEFLFAQPIARLPMKLLR